MAQRGGLTPILFMLAWIALAAQAAHGGEVVHGEDPDTGAPLWHWRGEGTSLRVAARFPGQTRAFFLGRGFPEEAAKEYSRSCVFHITLENLSGEKLRYTLDQWRVRREGQSRPPVPEQDWQARWRTAGVPERARTAFDWSMFPAEEELGQGGWALGMVSMGLEPGQRFDLVARWRQGGERREAALEDLFCPKAR
ncbi:MAG: hypothetical protein ACLFRB_08485 [Thiohalorhabdus sp.]|uniref:hypothetical protein n=1 Tax=Thiohalorhabdus sp. TaxID=3094134 RepID=UPI003981605A